MSNVKEALSTWDAADELLAEKIDKLNAELAIKADTKRIDDIATLVKFAVNGAGWYRIFTMPTVAATLARGAGDSSADIIIKRAYNRSDNEHHTISLGAVYNRFEFINENSISNIQIVDKIRFVTNNNDDAFIDIHLSDSAANKMCAYLLFPTIAFSDINSSWQPLPNNTVLKVEETVSDETVRAIYSFSANRTIESRLAALEAAVTATTSKTQ